MAAMHDRGLQFEESMSGELSLTHSGQGKESAPAAVQTTAVRFDVKIEIDNLRAFLNTAHLNTTRIEQVKTVLGNRAAAALIAGRVSASLALLLERATRCQWRIFSEERGMRASGRIARGQVHSLLGYYLDSVGAREFFAVLARLADAAIIDTRVLFAHRRLDPSASDRFNSDLLRAEEITDPFIREFTAAARAATIPILLGGHSVVSGGMYVLAEK